MFIASFEEVKEASIFLLENVIEYQDYQLALDIGYDYDKKGVPIEVKSALYTGIKIGLQIAQTRREKEITEYYTLLYPELDTEN